MVLLKYFWGAIMSEFVTNPIFYTDNKKIMITKSNTLIEAGFDLTVAEHDLMTLAINKLHKQETGGKEVFITAQEFAVANGVTDSHAYQVLKNTAKQLQERKLKFTLYVDKRKKLAGEAGAVMVVKPEHGEYEIVRSEFHWLQGVGYQDQNGFIYLMFSDPLSFLIERTGEAYTKFDYVKTIDFRGYSTKRIYELVCKWKDLGAIPFMVIDEWKELFGVSGKYPNVAEFKRRILEPAIEQINEQGEFELTLEQQKVGRIITHFSIKIKNKTKVKKAEPLRDVNTIDWLTGKADVEIKPLRLTSPQIEAFAPKIVAKIGSWHARMGESSSDYLNRVKLELGNSEKVEFYRQYLNELGFKM